MIAKDKLERLYILEGLSMQQIATKLDCSLNKVNYWLCKHSVKIRSRSEAVYIRNNPEGDPFTFTAPKTKDDLLLYGLGLGIFWGEGNKKDRYSVRVGNTDPLIIKLFIDFLETIFCVDKKRLRFGIQIFSDTPKNKALNFWCHELDVKSSQFHKVTVTISGSIGTYRQKSEYGVLTVYFHNKKLRDILVDTLRPDSSVVERLHGKQKVASPILARGSTST
jgi:hypothetical protein